MCTSHWHRLSSENITWFPVVSWKALYALTSSAKTISQKNHGSEWPWLRLQTIWSTSVDRVQCLGIPYRGSPCLLETGRRPLRELSAQLTNILILLKCPPALCELNLSNTPEIIKSKLSQGAPMRLEPFVLASTQTGCIQRLR